MAKREQIVLNRNGAPNNRNSVTFPRMVDFIKNEGTEEEIKWFVELCEANPDEKNLDYGVKIVKIRNEFIRRFWPTAYAPKTKVIEKAKRDYMSLKASVNLNAQGAKEANTAKGNK